MSESIAKWNIELNTICPHCKHHYDILEHQPCIIGAMIINKTDDWGLSECPECNGDVKFTAAEDEKLKDYFMEYEIND